MTIELHSTEDVGDLDSFLMGGGGQLSYLQESFRLFILVSGNPQATRAEEFSLNVVLEEES